MVVAKESVPFEQGTPEGAFGKKAGVIDQGFAQPQGAALLAKGLSDRLGTPPVAGIPEKDIDDGSLPVGAEGDKKIQQIKDLGTWLDAGGDVTGAACLAKYNEYLELRPFITGKSLTDADKYFREQFKAMLAAGITLTNEEIKSLQKVVPGLPESEKPLGRGRMVEWAGAGKPLLVQTSWLVEVDANPAKSFPKLTQKETSKRP